MRSLPSDAEVKAKAVDLGLIESVDAPLPRDLARTAMAEIIAGQNEEPQPAPRPADDGRMLLSHTETPIADGRVVVTVYFVPNN